MNEEYTIRCAHCYAKQAQLQLPFFGGEFVCEADDCGEMFWSSHFPDFDAYVSFVSELDFFASVARNALELEGLVGTFIICDKALSEESHQEILDSAKAIRDQLKRDRVEVESKKSRRKAVDETSKKMSDGLLHWDFTAPVCEPSGDKSTCPECEGSGEYVGLLKREKCRTCDGSGEVVVN